jgi:hypothetical protein
MPYISNPIGPFEYRDLMAGRIQLRGGGQTGGAGANHGNRFTGPLARRLGGDPAFAKATLDN